MADGEFKERNRLTPTGLTMFSCLREPKGFKGSQDDRTWNITISLSPDEGKAMLEELTAIAEKLRAAETARRKAIGKPTRDIPTLITHKVQSDGSFVFNFKKKEKGNNPPLTIDYNRNPIDPKILPGTKVQVAFNLNPYVLSSTNIFGATLQLIAVRTMDHDLPDSEIQGLFSKSPAPEKTQEEDINLDDLF